MENNENISFDDFMGAFDEADGNQTESETEAGMEETAAAETADDTQTEETAGEGGTQEPSVSSQEDRVGAESKSAPQNADTFTLKVNKEEKSYSREEVISLAQKGADYDRVKEQLGQSRQANQQLQTQLDSQKEAMDVLTEIAKDSKVELPQLLDELRMGLLRKQGLSDDAARERIARDKAEKENAALKAAQTQTRETTAQRAQREVADFRQAYPDVSLEKGLVDKLMGDVQGGMSLTEAYRKYESAQKDARIAELEAQIAAEKQNKTNRSSSPGSQRDSGGKRTKSDFDDFMEAFG